MSPVQHESSNALSLQRTNEHATKEGGNSLSRGPRLLLATTGSVASIKLPLLIKEIRQLEPRVELKVVSTDSSTHFLSSDELESLNVPVLRDKDEWDSWKRMGDPVLHIELRNWADAVVVAPLDANTLAKIANGLCDNLLTCVLRAWPASLPVVLCPAMNTAMYQNPFTSRHTQTIKEVLPNFEFIDPVSKRLACGDTGVGAMAPVSIIAERALEVAKKGMAIKEHEEGKLSVAAGTSGIVGNAGGAFADTSEGGDEISKSSTKGGPPLDERMKALIECGFEWAGAGGFPPPQPLDNGNHASPAKTQ
ncbi:flavo protein [Gonapodya prolifera JEL478]|uniref:Flavo protein n=1 Tax=Gonapodya prolifera (strain JEL478) TaxID=1344416 RepID=A0A139ADG1_GONPJ|nr:flavo protein [Gonapodya prolifera JEL478]|eukprot:KXS14699.1 flavo protein [Gonapodya prolifera JEL478]